MSLKLKTLVSKYENTGEKWFVRNDGKNKDNPMCASLKTAKRTFKSLGILDWHVLKHGDNIYAIVHPEQNKKPKNYYKVKFFKK